MKRRRLLFTLALGIFLTYAPTEISGQTSLNQGTKFPPGNWVVSFQPYTGPGHESMPVEVLSVKAETADSGLMLIQDYRFKNHSDKTVRFVQISAFISTEQEPDKVLFQQRVLRYSFSRESFGPQEEWQLPKSARHMASFAKGDDAVMKPFLKNGVLEGKYRISIGITKVIYGDGSIWVFQNPSNGDPN